MMHKYSSSETKKCIFDILCQFADFCKQHNLYYILSDGTLLGAIRHKGYIPWDDDVDVAMPRPDYEKFLELTLGKDNVLPSHLKTVSWRNKSLTLPFAKIYDTRTIAHENFAGKKGGGSHLWLDIFPMDGSTEDEKLLSKLVKKWLVCKRTIFLITADVTKGRTPIKRLFKLCFGWIFKLIPIYWACKVTDKFYQTYAWETSKVVAQPINARMQHFEKNAILTPVQVEFEGRYFNAPSNYDEYLRSQYKDYMQLPPIEKRVCHEVDAWGE